jgi:multiple sugar transport system substrate-binding protein
MFLSRAVAWAKHRENFSVFFDIATGEPLIDSPGFVRALEAAQTAVARMPPEVKTYSPADCRRELFAGKAALAVTFETGPVEMNTGATSVRRPEGMRVGIARLPGVREIYNRSTKSWTSLGAEEVNRVTLTGFAGLCGGVASSSTPAEAQAAWSLLAALSVDRFETAFSEVPRSPTRKSQTPHPESWTGPELDGEEQLAYVDAVSDALIDDRLVAEFPMAGRDQFRKSLTDALSQALASPGDPQAALKAVAEEWRTIPQPATASSTATAALRHRAE